MFVSVVLCAVPSHPVVSESTVKSVGIGLWLALLRAKKGMTSEHLSEHTQEESTTEHYNLKSLPHSPTYG